MKNTLSKHLHLMLFAALAMIFCMIPSAAFASTTVELGDSFQLSFPCCCDDPSEFTWSIDTDSNCVELEQINESSATGTFYAVDTGKDTVYFECAECGRHQTYTIYVEDNSGPQDIGLYLEDSNLVMEVGDTYQLDAYWNDPLADTDMRWSSSDSSVVKVSGSEGSATLKAVSEGRATVTITDRNSLSEASCYVEVQSDDNYEVTITKPSPAYYNVGDSPDALSVTARVNGSTDRGITYQWYSGSSYGNCTHKISGATDSDYYPDTSVAGDTYYSCVATYSVGSAYSEAASSPVKVSVTGDSYRLDLTSADFTLDTGDSTTLTARVYDGNNRLYSGSYDVNWSTNYPRVAYCSDDYSTLRSGKATTTLRAYADADAQTVRVTATVRINGKNYSDSINVKIRAVSTNYQLVVTTNKDRLVAGETAVITATLYKDGKLYNPGSTTITWSLRNGNNAATLNRYTSNLSSGSATTELTAKAASGITNVGVLATVTYNKTDYTKAVNVLIDNSSDAQSVTPVTPTTVTKNIQMQINNNVIVCNGTMIQNDVPPVIMNGRTMVPLRVVSDLLGGTVNWNAATQCITIVQDGQMLTMTIGQTIPGFDVAPVIMNSRTYVPIRYVAEALGANVDWVAASQQIIITK